MLEVTTRRQFSTPGTSDGTSERLNLEQERGKDPNPGGGGGEGTPHMKEVGMLVVSLRDVNFVFWSHLGCSGQNAIIFNREGLV